MSNFCNLQVIMKVKSSKIEVKSGKKAVKNLKLEVKNNGKNNKIRSKK